MKVSIILKRKGGSKTVLKTNHGIKIGGAGITKK